MLYHLLWILALIGAVGTGFGLDLFASLQCLWQLPLIFAGFYGGFLFLVLFFLFLWCLPIDLDKPQEEDSPKDRKILNAYAKLACQLLRVKVQAEGLDKIPNDGRFMLVCNHLSIMDPVVLSAYAPEHQLAFISKRENNSLPAVNKLMHRTMCQLINRENNREALVTILNCVKILKEDKANIAVFPEGYTSRDGKFHVFRNGVFKIAQRAKVPIVVCTIDGTRPIFQNARRLKRSPVSLKVLDVIPAEETAGQTKDVGDRIHALMAASLGQPDQIPGGSETEIGF